MLARGDRLMGFGHRVYKVRDPRADVLSKAAEQFYGSGGDKALYDLAREVEKVALRVLEPHKPGPAPANERRILHGARAARSRHPGPAFHADVRDRAGRRMDGALLRATQRDPHHAPRVQVPGTARSSLGAARRSLTGKIKGGLTSGELECTGGTISSHGSGVGSRHLRLGPRTELRRPNGPRWRCGLVCAERELRKFGSELRHDSRRLRRHLVVRHVPGERGVRWWRAKRVRHWRLHVEDMCRPQCRMRAAVGQLLAGARLRQMRRPGHVRQSPPMRLRPPNVPGAARRVRQHSRRLRREHRVRRVPGGPNVRRRGPEPLRRTPVHPQDVRAAQRDVRDGLGRLRNASRLRPVHRPGDVRSGGVANQCACRPKSCGALGKDCGSVTDGCGGKVQCGACASPATCGGTGTPNRCGCNPATCASVGAGCGTILDRCGGTVDCGPCPGTLICGGGGGPNGCGAASCNPQSCDGLGFDCGVVSDGCSKVLNCGTCGSGTVCAGNHCTEVAGGGGGGSEGN
jgi:hypothetical protein